MQQHEFEDMAHQVVDNSWNPDVREKIRSDLTTKGSGMSDRTLRKVLNNPEFGNSLKVNFGWNVCNSLEFYLSQAQVAEGHGFNMEPKPDEPGLAGFDRTLPTGHALGPAREFDPQKYMLVFPGLQMNRGQDEQPRQAWPDITCPHCHTVIKPEDWG
jgi:hypothetical protein